MLRINGEIMSRDKVIATVREGVLESVDADLLPLYLRRTGDVEGWLAGRAIDTHRPNSRLLKKALRLTGTEDAELVLKVNAVTITDTYWFRERGVALSYGDVRFQQNLFDKLALFGDPDSFNLPYSPTPELTNTGSFEKCWRLEGGRWWIIKQGSELERFSELFICRLGQALGFPMAEYHRENGTIKSPDFTDGGAVNYEPAESLVGENEDYAYNFDLFRGLSPVLARQYLQIIYLDTLCFNMDRHSKNYGVLRDVESGTILSMAPNFDNNIALFSRGIPADLTRRKDKLVSLFCEFLAGDTRALELARSLPVPTREMILQAAADTGISVEPDVVCQFVLNGAARMDALLSAQEPDRAHEEDWVPER